VMWYRYVATFLLSCLMLLLCCCCLRPMCSMRVQLLPAMIKATGGFLYWSLHSMHRHYCTLGADEYCTTSCSQVSMKLLPHHHLPPSSEYVDASTAFCDLIAEGSMRTVSSRCCGQCSGKWFVSMHAIAVH
jgi:hypothetical protein